MANLLVTNRSSFSDFVQRSLASYQAIAFVSFEKSSGKSTAFRAFLHAAEGITCGITSLGADPANVKEPTDGEHLYFVKPGTIIATARQCLPLCEPTRTILAHTQICTPLGEVIIFRAESAGRVFLAGPSIIADAISIKKNLLEFGAECVLMDGAGARISPANPRLVDGVVLCTNLTPDMAQTRENLQFQIHLLQTRQIEDERLCELVQQTHTDQFPFTLIDQDYQVHKPINSEGLTQLIASTKLHIQMIRAINISGALTDKQSEVLVKFSETNPALVKQCTLIVEDPTRLLLSSRTMDSIQASPLSLCVLRPIHLLGIALNPAGAGVEPHQLRIMFENFSTDWRLPVFDVQGGVLFENSD